MKHDATSNHLMELNSTLLDRYGNRGWWPAETPFETIIGAILAQNVSWNNAKKAILNLERAGLLDPRTLRDSGPDKIAPHIISSRYYNQKARKISVFMQFFYADYDGDLDRMSEEDLPVLRKKLMSLNGFGEETVDSILLYACTLPVFVVDAYTKRIFSRYGFVRERARYDEVQQFFMQHVPRNVALYNDYHAQIVHLGNTICRTHPLCHLCPIRSLPSGIGCEYARMKDTSA